MPHLASLRDADAAVAALDSAADTRRGAWTLAQTLHHCADSIEASLTGYPKLKPAVIRATVGALVKRRFLARGAMRHDLNAPLPGGSPPTDGPLADAVARLRRAIDAFSRHEGPLQPHPVYGACNKAEYDALHAMHIADHLEPRA